MYSLNATSAPHTQPLIRRVCGGHHVYRVFSAAFTSFGTCASCLPSYFCLRSLRLVCFHRCAVLMLCALPQCNSFNDRSSQTSCSSYMLFKIANWSTTCWFSLWYVFFECYKFSALPVQTAVRVSHDRISGRVRLQVEFTPSSTSFDTVLMPPDS